MAFGNTVAEDIGGAEHPGAHVVARTPVGTALLLTAVGVVLEVDVVAGGLPGKGGPGCVSFRERVLFDPS